MAVGVKVNGKGITKEDEDATVTAEAAMDEMLQGMRHHVQGRAGTMTEDEIRMRLKRGEIACGQRAEE